MFQIGVDIGQQHDPTAFVILENPERAWVNNQRIYNALAPLPPELHVRRAERVPLGTPYPRVVEKLRDLARSRPFAGNCALIVDGTGVGAPVVDMLRAAELGCEITSVVITGGERQTGFGSSRINVPKKDLIASVQIALEKGELRIGRRIKDAQALVRELINTRISAARIEADGAGEHDDLVIALALACWKARRQRDFYGPGRLPWL